jgi:prolyl oligopeptidase
LLFGFAASGSEQTTLKVLDRASSRSLSDTIDRLESDYVQPCWLPDGKSFVYCRRQKVAPDAPATDGYKFTQAFCHTIGRAVESDAMVFAQGAPGSPGMAEMDFPAVIVPVGSTWAIGQVKHGDESDLSLYAVPLATLGTPDARWTKVCDRGDLVTEFAVHGDDIFLLGAQDAPRFKVVRTSLSAPDLKTAKVVLPAGDYVVDSLAVARDALYVGIMHGVQSKILRVPYAESAQPRPLALSAEEPSGRVTAARADLDGVFIGTNSWIRTGRLYQYDPKTQNLADTRLLPQGRFDAPESLAATEVMVPSHDGVMVPLSIIHR